MYKGMEIIPVQGKKKVKKKKKHISMTTQRHRYTTQWHIWHDQKWLDDNLEIHSASSANSGLISYVFFKYHFYNGCHKYLCFLIAFQMKHRSGRHFQPHTAQAIFTFVMQPTQDGPAFPQRQPVVSYPLCLCRQHSFLLEYPPLFYWEVYLLILHEVQKNDFLLVISFGTSLAEGTPLSPDYVGTLLFTPSLR